MTRQEQIKALAERSRLLGCSISAARKYDKAMAENYRIEKFAVDRQLRSLRKSGKTPPK